MSNFEKLTFLFFSDSDSFGSKKNRAKKIFSKFENFSVSVFQGFSVSVFQSIFVIRLSPNLSRFSTKDRGEKSFVGTETLFLEIGVDPLRCPLAP